MNRHVFAYDGAPLKNVKLSSTAIVSKCPVR